MFVVLMIAVMLRPPPIVAALLINRGATNRLAGIYRHAAFDYLVKFTSIEPDTPTLWAIVNLNTGTLGHYEINGGADRTFHVATPKNEILIV